MYKILLSTIMSLMVGLHVYASELTHEFKNPSFSGQGYSTHVLSIEQLQFQRKKEAKEKAEALQRQIARDAAQETLAKFLKNVESRIYANLSKNLVDSMFSNDGSNTGTASIEGATIYSETPEVGFSHILLNAKVGNSHNVSDFLDIVGIYEARFTKILGHRCAQQVYGLGFRVYSLGFP